MKSGPVSKLDKKNKKAPKSFKNDAVLANCDVISIFPIYGEFGAIRKPVSQRVACKSYFFIKTSILSYKTGKETKQSLTQLSLYCF